MQDVSGQLLNPPGFRSQPLVLAFPPFRPKLRSRNFLTLDEGNTPAADGGPPCLSVRIARALCKREILNVNLTLGAGFTYPMITSLGDAVLRARFFDRTLGPSPAFCFDVDLAVCELNAEVKRWSGR